MFTLVDIGGGLVLIGLGMVVWGLKSNKTYDVWLCLLGVLLVGKGLSMFGWVKF